MLLLQSTDILRITLGSATNVDVNSSYVDRTSSSGAITPARPANIEYATAGTTTIVGSPTSGDVRNVKQVTIHNTEATSNAVTVEMYDGTKAATLWKGTLQAEESLMLDENGVWNYLDAGGAIHAPQGQFATQAEMEAASSLVKYVSPGNLNWHPAACKAWVKAGVTGNVLSSWNITSLSDTGTGDVAVTIATDFSGADAYCASMSVQRINSTGAVANLRVGTIKTASMAAGSVSMDCWDGTATTSVIKDPTSWHLTMFGDQ